MFLTNGALKPVILLFLTCEFAAPNGINTDRCDPQCESHQCCDRDEEGNHKCFCLQAKVNNHKEYVKRPCESMYIHIIIALFRLS